MYKISGIEQHVDKIVSGPQKGLLREIYKKSIKPGEEKKDEPITSRLLRAGLVGLATAGTTYGISSLLHKNKDKRIPIKYLIPGALMTATAGYFFPEHRNEIIDYHQHKDDKLLKENLSKLNNSERNIYNRSNEVIDSIKNTIEMSKQSSILPFLGRAAGAVVNTAGRVGSGFVKGLAPVAKTAPIGQKVRGIASKGVALTGLGIGAYKGYQAVSRPVSEGNYTTFLRNNILSGNINANEITDRDKSQINNLGMR
jgi:hypothetical protein